jgi:hypothetical protein
MFPHLPAQAFLTPIQVVNPIETTLNGGLYVFSVLPGCFILIVAFCSAVQRSNVFTNTTLGAVS